MYRSLLASLVAVVAVGCSTSTVDTASSESANTEGQPLTVIKGREWGRCWFDVVGTNAQLSCTSTARGEDPLAAKVSVSGVASMASPSTPAQTFSKDLDIEAGGTVVVATIPRASFPVIMILDATLAASAREMLGATGHADLQSVPTIAKPEDAPASQPLVMKQPFDLWPAAFIDGTGQDGAFVVSMAEPYTRSIAPYESFGGATSLTLNPYVSGRAAKGKLHYFVAPESGPVAMKLDTRGAEHPFSLANPGYYTATAEGLRPATPAEIAADFPPGTTPAPVAPTPTDPTPFDPPPPPAPIDADPTCGGDGQARCSNGACDEGTRYLSSTNKCVACGSDGRITCLDGANNASGNVSCNEGSRYLSSSNTCVACGSNGLITCLSGPNNASGDVSCNEGSRYLSSTNKCVACGSDGLITCLDGPNNATGNVSCNDGTRYLSSSNTCKTCGGVGQISCLDGPNNATGSPKCNAGLRYISSSNTCQL